MAKKPAAAKAKGTIAAAAMTSSAGGKLGGGPSLGKLVEDAMSAAVTKAYAEGITDSAEILELKLAAREQVKAEFRAAEAERNRKIQEASEA